MAKYIDENGFAHFLGKLKTLLDRKVNTESGKGLSTNDYTTAEKNKLAGIAANANNYSLPTASADTKGGVKIGAGLTMTGEVLSADVQSVPVMTGATASADGTAGLVPAPDSNGYNYKYLRADGSWSIPPNSNDRVSVTYAPTTKASLLATTYIPVDASDSSCDPAVTDPDVYLDTTAGKLTATSFSGSGAELTNLNGSNISSGTVAAARIADLPASKITSGTFDTARIPSLPASKITSGTFSTARIPDLPATKLPTMTGATSSAAGTAGIVPAPAAGSQGKVLAGGGWGDLIAYIASAASSPAPYTNYNRQLYIGINDSNVNYLGTGILIPNATSSDPGFMSSADKSKLDAFGAASTYALKSDITSMYKHKGSVSSTSNLPSSGQTEGDVYNVTATGMNYVWTGSEWDALGEIFTINSMTTTEIDSAFVTAGLAAA